MSATDNRMNAPPTADARIDIGLKSLRLMLGDLPEVADEWSCMDELEQASWSLDWDQLMGSYLRLLERYHRAGEMNEAQRARYRELREVLDDLLPLIERLDLYPPALILDQDDL